MKKIMHDIGILIVMAVVFGGLLALLQLAFYGHIKW